LDNPWDPEGKELHNTRDLGGKEMHNPWDPEGKELHNTQDEGGKKMHKPRDLEVREVRNPQQMAGKHMRNRWVAGMLCLVAGSMLSRVTVSSTVSGWDY